MPCRAIHDENFPNASVIMSNNNFMLEEIITDITKNLNNVVDELHLLSERHIILEEKLTFAYNQVS